MNPSKGCYSLLRHWTCWERESQSHSLIHLPLQITFTSKTKQYTKNKSTQLHVARLVPVLWLHWWLRWTDVQPHCTESGMQKHWFWSSCSVITLACLILSNFCMCIYLYLCIYTQTCRFYMYTSKIWKSKKLALDGRAGKTGFADFLYHTSNRQVIQVYIFVYFLSWYKHTVFKDQTFINCSRLWISLNSLLWMFKWWCRFCMNVTTLWGYSSMKGYILFCFLWCFWKTSVSVR